MSTNLDLTAEVEEIMNAIDAASGTSRMTQQQAVDFMESIREELGPRIDAIRSEMEADETS